MKRIEAIIRPAKVADVCEALDKAGHAGVTISAVEGMGLHQGWTHHVRSMTYTERVLAKARIEVVAKDEDAGSIINAVRAAALTGKEGDGMIFVHDLADAIRIRTNESGAEAL